MDELVVDEAGQRDDRDLRVAPMDFTGGGDPVHTGHDEVHEYDGGQSVGVGKPADRVEGVLTVLRLTNYGHIIQLGEVGPQAPADHRVIVYQEHPEPGRRAGAVLCHVTLLRFSPQRAHRARPIQGPGRQLGQKRAHLGQRQS